MDSHPLQFALVAGEASGDLLAGMLLRGLRLRWPALVAHGIGGSHMVQQGFEAWWPSERLAVRGYVEVLPRLRELLTIRRELGDRLLNQRPDLFVGIDAPDFNLDLEIRLREAGVKVIHFVSPSFWAWRANKVDKLKRAVDHVLCLFPFEPALLAGQGIAATYVGHPLAQAIPMQPDRDGARQALGVPGKATVVAILPGSRESEIRYLGRRFFDAAALLAKSRPDTEFLVPALPSLRQIIQQAATSAGLGPRLHLVDGQSHAVLAASDVALVASGTATLEAALFKRPMVIAYNMNVLSWMIMRRKQLQPWVGLPNILCQEFVVPELLQDAATPQALADALGDWLDQPDKTAALVQRFTTLHQELRRDTVQLATHAIESLLAR